MLKSGDLYSLSRILNLFSFKKSSFVFTVCFGSSSIWPICLVTFDWMWGVHNIHVYASSGLHLLLMLVFLFSHLTSMRSQDFFFSFGIIFRPSFHLSISEYRRCIVRPSVAACLWIMLPSCLWMPWVVGSFLISRAPNVSMFSLCIYTQSKVYGYLFVSQWRELQLPGVFDLRVHNLPLFEFQFHCHVNPFHPRRLLLL